MPTAQLCGPWALWALWAFVGAAPDRTLPGWLCWALLSALDQAASAVPSMAASDGSTSPARRITYHGRACGEREGRGRCLLPGKSTTTCFRTLVYRTDLITDPRLLADAELALRVQAGRPVTRGGAGRRSRSVVAVADDTMRQVRERGPVGR